MIKLKTKYFTFLFLGILFFSIFCSVFALQSLSIRNNDINVGVDNFRNMETSSSPLGSSFNVSMANASFFGEYSKDKSGNVVAGIGDVNNDGYDDFLIGANQNDDGGVKAGKAYLFYGGESIWASNLNCSKSNASFIGEDQGNYVGLALAGAGDVNNDGYDDFLIGAHQNDDFGYNTGKAYLFYGGKSSWGRNTNCSNANASFYGEYESDVFGSNVVVAGDVNNDGYDDFLVGAACYNREGKAYLFYGGNSIWGRNTNCSNANASFIGEYEKNNNEIYVTGLGDVNGDKYDDFLLGDRLSDDFADKAGKAYLFYGDDSIWSGNISCSKANASFIGEKAGDNIGEVMAYAGDVNNDGYNDFLLSSSDNEEGGTSTGQTYLFFGGQSNWIPNMNVSKANASFIGQNINENSGCYLAGGANINDDEYADFLIGAKGYEGEGIGDANVTGRIYLFLGAPTDWKMDTNCSKANVTIMGEDNSEYFGSSVAFIGDINGDGSEDILGGAPSNSDERNLAGKTYLFLGEDDSDGGGSSAQLIPGYNFYLILGILGFSILIFTRLRKTNITAM